MLPLSWRHSICRLATILLRIFHKRTGPRKTQHSFKATSSDSPNLRRDLTQPSSRAAFSTIRRLKWAIDFLLPKPVFKLLSGHAGLKKIWLLHRFPRKQNPPVGRVQNQFHLDVRSMIRRIQDNFMQSQLYRAKICRHLFRSSINGRLLNSAAACLSPL